MTQAFVRVPNTAAVGEVISVKVLIRHQMESGFRRDRVGKRVPRNIINRFTAEYDGEEVFAMDLFPGIAANPFFEFTTLATRTGPLTCRWIDDAGQQYSKSADVNVA